MGDAEVARLVRSLGGGPLSDTTVRRIVERAEGNAFYAEELLAATDAESGGVPVGSPTFSSFASSNCPTPPSRCCVRPLWPGGASSTTC